MASMCHAASLQGTALADDRLMVLSVQSSPILHIIA